MICDQLELESETISIVTVFMTFYVVIMGNNLLYSPILCDLRQVTKRI